MKYKPQRSSTVTRTAPPIPFETKKGAIELRCPFCQDHHAILPNIDSPCGTRIEVSCVQEYYPARTVKHDNLICVKCHKSGGEMARHNNSFVHLTNCSPETVLLQETPKDSKLAKFVFNLHPKVKKFIFDKTGFRPDQVLEVDEMGDKTGKVLAHFFWSNSRGKQIST